MKRILLVSHVDMNLYLFRRTLIEALLQKSCEVFTAAPEGPYTEDLRNLGAQTLTYGVVRGSLGPGHAFKAAQSLRQVIRQVQPDIAHSFTHLPNLLTRLTAARPVVVNSVTGLGSFFLGAGVKGALAREFFGGLYKLTSPRCRAVVFQNPDDLDLFKHRRWMGKSMPVLIRGSGVDLKRFKPGAVPPESVQTFRNELGLTPENVVFTLAGRLVRDKGVFEFLEAVRRAAAELPRARFLLVGEPDPGNLSSISARELEDMRNSENLIPVGWRRDMDLIWAASDVAVLPSYREGLPVTMQEAAASGLPVITSDAPGCRELAGPGTILVPARDAGSLYNAVARLAGDNDLRKSMGQSSRSKAEAEFDARMLAGQHIQLYRELLEA